MLARKVESVNTFYLRLYSHTCEIGFAGSIWGPIGLPLSRKRYEVDHFAPLLLALYFHKRERAHRLARAAWAQVRNSSRIAPSSKVRRTAISVSFG